MGVIGVDGVVYRGASALYGRWDTDESLDVLEQLRDRAGCDRVISLPRGHDLRKRMTRRFKGKFILLDK